MKKWSNLFTHWNPVKAVHARDLVIVWRTRLFSGTYVSGSNWYVSWCNVIRCYYHLMYLGEKKCTATFRPAPSISPAFWLGFWKWYFLSHVDLPSLKSIHKVPVILTELRSSTLWKPQGVGWMLEARLRGWHLFDGKVGWMIIWPVSGVDALDMAAIVTTGKISHLGCLSSKHFASLSTLLWLALVLLIKSSRQPVFRTNFGMWEEGESTLNLKGRLLRSTKRSRKKQYE